MSQKLLLSERHGFAQLKSRRAARLFSGPRQTRWRKSTTGSVFSSRSHRTCECLHCVSGTHKKGIGVVCLRCCILITAYKCFSRVMPVNRLEAASEVADLVRALRPFLSILQSLLLSAHFTTCSCFQRRSNHCKPDFVLQALSWTCLLCTLRSALYIYAERRIYTSLLYLRRRISYIQYVYILPLYCIVF